MRQFILVAAFTSAFLSSPFLHAAERQLATLQGLSAIVQDNFCRPNAAIRVIAPDASEFSGDKINLQRLIGALRVPLSMECPSAKVLTINGEVNGQQVYQGSVSEVNEWVLKDAGSLALSNNSTQQLNKRQTDEQFKAEMLEKIRKLRQENNIVIENLDKKLAEADAERADKYAQMAKETREEMEKNALKLSNGKKGFLSKDGTTFETLDGNVTTDPRLIAEAKVKKQQLASNTLAYNKSGSGNLNEKESWQTYTNREYCYSIEYPNWKLNDQDSHGFSIYFPGTLPPASYSDGAQGGYILVYGLNVSLEESLKMTLAILERNNKKPRSLTNFPLKLNKPVFGKSPDRYNVYVLTGNGAEGEQFFQTTVADPHNSHTVTMVTFVYKDHADSMYKMAADDEQRMFRSIRFGC